jgi:2-keto-4-pentenoate hydratase/2-oxohepta-3-ene-1,7-dioic acid hydratase in catechol pathway
MQRPSKIIGIGQNYRAHAQEMGKGIPEEPLMFLKPPSAVIADGMPIERPAGYERVDYEGDLGVVIGKRTRAKGFDTFCPIGPRVVPGLDPSTLHVTTRVNGVVKQDSPTSDLIFDVPTLISFVTQHMTLEPGDIISTGTPSGVGNLNPGDVVEVEIGGIGVLRNPVIARP